VPASGGGRRGPGVVLVVFDLLRNEPVRRLRAPFESTSAAAVQVSHVAVTTNDRFVAVAVRRPSDHVAVFVVFDLSSDLITGSAKFLFFDAAAQVTPPNWLMQCIFQIFEFGGRGVNIVLGGGSTSIRQLY